MKTMKIFRKRIKPSLLPVMKILAEAQTETTGFFLLDMKNKTIEFTKQVLAFFGIQEMENISGQKLLELIVHEDILPVRRFFRQCLSGEQQNESISFRLQGAQSMPVWLQCTVKKIRSRQAADVLLGIVTNKTDETNYRIIVDSCLDGMFIGDLRSDKAVFSGKIFNELWLESGMCENATQLYNDIIIEEDKEFHKKYLEHIVASKQETNRIEYRVYTKNRDSMWISNRNRIVYGKDGLPSMVVGGFININELKSYNKYVQTTAETCEITGLFNLFRLKKDLKQKSKEEGARGFVFYFNVDDFTTVSRAFEFSAGNEFLKEVGIVLQKNSPPKGVFYHIEPGTFVLLLPNETKDQALKIMKHYKGVTDMPVIVRGVSCPYSLSMAAIPYASPDVYAEEILEKCAFAMKKLRLGRKNKYLLFTPKIYKEYYVKLALKSRLCDSVLRNMDGFFLLYQPFIEAKENQCIGAEALLRWRDPQDGAVLSPAVFIPILEEMEMMEIAGEWVFKTAARQCKQWIEKGFDEDFYISINVSTPQLSGNNFANMVLHYLKEIKLETKNIILEITESVLMLDFQRGMKQLNQLKQKGIKLALDDFGTGYSSLSYLKNLPIDEIKIDRSFIQDIEFDAFSREFVASIIKIAQTMRRLICLEGVETEFQMDILKQMEADLFQGFLFGRPQEKSGIEQAYYQQKALHQ